jgi:SAM-dependent methyltransferase
MFKTGRQTERRHLNPLRLWFRDTLIRVGRVANNDLATRVDQLAVTQAASAGISRASIAAHYLRGLGLEIGALHRSLPLPPGVSAHYVDAAPIEQLRKRFPGIANIRPPDIVDNGEQLGTVADATYDFIIANHFLEHTENPFATLGNFVRVLRPGGRIYMAVPDKRWTFDRDRPITTLDHLLTDYREGPQVSRRAHYDEWLRIIDHHTGDELARRTEAFIRDGVNIHFHVWTIAEMSEMFMAARKIVGLPLEVKLAFADPPMQEVVWVLEVVNT